MTRMVHHLGLGIASLVLVAFAFSMAAAQSGRKPPPKRSEPPLPSSTADPAPTPPPTPEPETPKISISAGKFTQNFSMPQQIGDYVFQACMDRFKQASKTYQLLAAGEMNRKGAADLAKKGEGAWVLLLEFAIDTADPAAPYVTNADLRNCIVTYTLFTPQTGKVRTQGRLYFSADRYYANNGGVLGTIGRVGNGTRNYTPDEAGHKVAESVMDSLATSGTPTSIPLPR